jgi:NRPS condensation-like uncharacterized protein
MKHQNKVEWKRLDNAAKIFPPTSNDKDTKVFRFALELYEKVDPNILQVALDLTIESFPLYKVVLRRGVFWYYFEQSNIKPTVEIESNTVCAPIFVKDEKNLLFRVFYYGKRINLEIHHSLSDGTGALWFMKTLIHHYLLKKYKEDFKDKIPESPYYASLSEKSDDSFQKYYTGESKIRYTKGQPAYRIYGTRLEDNRTTLIEGSMSVKAVLEEAHRYDTTLTGFLTSLFLYSIYKEMSVRDKKRPVVISVPVNLRQFFRSETARNFFSTIQVKYDFRDEEPSLEEIIKVINHTLKSELTSERLNMQLNRFMTLEKNKILKFVPLPLKDFVLRFADRLNERRITAALSNIGKITLPESFRSYIHHFSVCTSARRPQIALCSYEDNLTISFTSPYVETEIQRNFFEFLSEKGIDIRIASNLKC